MTRMADGDLARIPPQTDAERNRALAALERIKRRLTVLLVANGGRLFPNAADEIAELRAERDAEPQ